jgi:hypothetical protein
MARRTDKTGAGQLPAEIYKFPPSGSASHTDEEHGAQPANLSSAELRLYDELLALARRLDKRGVSGVYGLVASVADQVTSLKGQGRDTVGTLARGLDALKQIDASHTSKRLQTMREAVVEHEEIGGVAAFLVLASGSLLAGYSLVSIFFLSVAAIFTVPTLLDLMTRR